MDSPLENQEPADVNDPDEMVGLIARWGGDEFLVVGMGIESDPDAITARIELHIRASDIDMNRWPGEISVGSAHGMPSAVTVDELIARADERMYSARRVRREGVDQA